MPARGHLPTLNRAQALVGGEVAERELDGEQEVAVNGEDVGWLVGKLGLSQPPLRLQPDGD